MLLFAKEAIFIRHISVMLQISRQLIKYQKIKKELK
jgi:hypothetical protein